MKDILKLTKVKWIFPLTGMALSHTEYRISPVTEKVLNSYVSTTASCKSETGAKLQLRTGTFDGILRKKDNGRDRFRKIQEDYEDEVSGHYL